MSANHYAIFQGYICTANADGSIPLNSKIIAKIYTEDQTAMERLIELANVTVSFSSFETRMEAARKVVA